MGIERAVLGRSRPIVLPALLVVLLGCALSFAATGGDGATGESAAAALRSPESYGGWVLAPAGLAILCAIATRQVVPALILGTVLAAYMLTPCLPPEASFAEAPRAIRVLRLTTERYVIDAIVDRDHVKVILFTLIIGGMVGVIGSNGGTRALVDIIARRALNRRRGQITAWVAGLVVFFDDYANSMIVGPTMQPICDRLRISRAKLAYIVDSTAAPVASIALIGTWVGAEIGYIQQGIDAITQRGEAPAFLAGVDGWQAFLNSIPYRFYPIFAIVLVLLVAVTGRDFGPMRRAELSAANEAPENAEAAPDESRGAWWLAGIPILALILITCGVLAWPGIANRSEGEPLSFKSFFDNADAYASILYGAISSATVAIVITVLFRRGTLKLAMDAFLDGMARMFPAVTVLVLAWALSASSQDLHVGEVVRSWLLEKQFSLRWLPLAVFVSAAGVSFATGTSWGTMGILCPMVVTVAAGLAATLPAHEALPLFYASIGGVLAGAIFGDHCSPISDTTVLSSIASGCGLAEHVWTQMPYAVLAALAEIVAGDVLCSVFGLSPWVGLGLGVAMLFLILRLIGRRPEAPRLRV